MAVPHEAGEGDSTAPQQQHHHPQLQQLLLRAILLWERLTYSYVHLLDPRISLIEQIQFLVFHFIDVNQGIKGG